MMQLPKPPYKSKKTPKSKKAKTLEKEIQSIVDTKLKAYNIYTQRIGDSVYSTLFSGQSMPLWKKKLISDSIGGVADNIAMIPISDKFCLAVHLECKSDKGKLSQGQEKRAKQVPYNIIRTEQEFDSVLKEFSDMADKIIEFLEGEL